MTYDPARGSANVDRVLHAATAEDFVRDLSWDGFLWLIRQRLDTIYPAPNFRADQYGVMWSGEHGGSDIDPGVKWATLLDMALKEVGA